MLPPQYSHQSHHPTNQIMSQHHSNTPHTNLEPFFKKMHKQKFNPPSIVIEDVDQQLEMMLSEANEKGYSQQQSTINTKTSTTLTDIQKAKSRAQNNRKVYISDYFNDNPTNNSTRLYSIERSRTRDNKKKSKKVAKMDRGQRTLQQFFPGFSIKFSKPKNEQKHRKQRQLTLQDFIKKQQQKQNNPYQQ